MIELILAIASLVMPQAQAELVFAGDAMQHQRQIDAARRAGGELDYSDYFTRIKPYVSSADYAVVNLETPLGGPPYSGYPMFSAHDNYLTALTDAGFDLMLSANNHILDRRDKGLLRTIETFENAGVPWLGIYRSAEHRQECLPFIKDINGFKIAFLNYTYGTNGIRKQTSVEIDYIDRDLINNDVRNAREAGAELIAVCIHWGEEYKLIPNNEQKNLARFISSLGVEMIIGSHPHVIQPIELIPGEANRRPTLTVYSLGNFISAMRTDDTRGGAMVRVKLRRDLSGRAYISDASYRMVFTHVPVRQGENYRLIPAESDSIHNSVRIHRDRFVSNAMRIYNRHNINVLRDTLPISEYESE